MRVWVALVVALGLVACGGSGDESNSASEDRGSVAEIPVEGPIVAPEATIAASSAHQTYGPEGLLRARQPGWHARVPPQFPEWVEVNLEEPRTASNVSFLPQDGARDRSPKRVRIETSTDGKSWSPIMTIEDACPEMNRWRTFDLPKATELKRIRLTFESNCGSESFLTFRGLKFE